MEINLTHVTAARRGAACLGVFEVRSEWAVASVAGLDHALASDAVLAAGTLGTLSVTSRPVPAPTGSGVGMTAGYLPAANGTRKQKNVQMTRIDAGGNGAMGPYPEREQPPA